MPINTAPALRVTDEQRAELTRTAASTVLPHRKVVQAKALLLAADGSRTRRSRAGSRWTRTRCAGGVPGLPSRGRPGSV